MSGHIHFVTPTNRWIGSIPLHTLDPLTLEPLSSYLGNPETLQDDDLLSDRTTNIIGQPVSLILARLLTPSQTCPCGCTIPTPPKNANYYHAQHLLRLLFQTQRVRSRALRPYLPQFFDQPDENDSEDDPPPLPRVHITPSPRRGNLNVPDTVPSVVLPMDNLSLALENSPSSSLEAPTAAATMPTTPGPVNDRSRGHGKVRPRKQKRTPKWVHSLIQSRSLRNPLTNTDIEGDPTFFLVLESGKGGWWHEPWVMTSTDLDSARPSMLCKRTRPSASQDHPSETLQPSSSHATSTTLSAEDPVQSDSVDPVEKITASLSPEEKELRKERWRQRRIVNLEIEAQHELDWRRWQRSLLEREPTEIQHAAQCGPSKEKRSKRRERVMRLKIARDIVLLELKENGLRFPKRRQKKTCLDGIKRAVSCNPVLGGSIAIDNCSALSLKDIRGLDHLSHQEQDSNMSKSSMGLHDTKKRIGSVARMPWWDPDPRPFRIPITKLSPFAVSTLPEPVANHFGGVSIYASSPGDPIYEHHPVDSSPEKIEEPPKNPPTSINCNDHVQIPVLDDNVDGCRWVPVPEGDRMAVMIGTSQDFLLFPSLQRLFFRHLSREDYGDRIGRVGVIPCPATTIVMDRSQSHTHSNIQEHYRNSLDERYASSSISTQVDLEAGTHPEPTDYPSLPTPQEVTQRTWRSWFRGRSRRSDASNHVVHSDSSVQQSMEMAPAFSILESILSRGADEKTGSGSLHHSPPTDELVPEHHIQTHEISSNIEDSLARDRFNKEIFEREDYDSSEFSFGSDSDSIRDDGEYSMSGSDTGSTVFSSGEESDDSRATTPHRIVGSTPRGWIQRMIFRRSPQPMGTSPNHEARSAARSANRARRQQRQRRRARNRHQRELQRIREAEEIEHGAIYRAMPVRIQRIVTPSTIQLCWQMAEFCRFYITILVAITLMCAIVYGAIHAESGDTWKRKRNS